MPGEAAITKFKTRLAAWLDGHIGAGIGLHLERPYDEPFHEGEMDCVNIRVPQCDAALVAAMNAWEHTARVEFDLICKSAASGTISEAQAEIAAAIVDRLALLDATTGGLGEMLQAQANGLLAAPLSLGPQQDEMMMSDNGEAVFAWSFVWLTPINDFRTVAGQNGLIA